MEFFGKHKIIILTVLGVAVAIGVWLGFAGETPPDTLITTHVYSDAGTEDESLVDTLLQLRAVSLSGTIFSDPAFKSLRDFGTQIIPEQIGRPNPFAPVSIHSATPKANPKNTKLFLPENR